MSAGELEGCWCTCYGCRRLHMQMYCMQWKSRVHLQTWGAARNLLQHLLSQR